MFRQWLICFESVLMTILRFSGCMVQHLGALGFRRLSQRVLSSHSIENIFTQTLREGPTTEAAMLLGRLESRV